MGFSLTKNLDPRHPGEEHLKKMILDPDLKLPKPCNVFGVGDLGMRVWGGGSSGGRELGAEDMGSGVGVRERFKCCGAQSDQLGLDRSDRSPIPV